MNRLTLSLPVCLLGLPLLICLIVAAPPSGAWTRPVIDVVQTPVITPVKSELPDNDGMERLAREDPIAFLENCIRRYDKEVNSYRLHLHKHEFAGGKLHPPEEIDICFREQPYSVYFQWVSGARKAERVLYVEGENLDKKGKSLMLARPNGGLARAVVGDVVEREVDGEDARQSGRYPMNKFGLKKSCERTLATWIAARAEGTLHIDYLGERKVPELENRVCWVLRRRNEKPEYDGVMEVTAFIDKETWLQAGSIVKGKDSKLIGEYYFGKIELNPQFKDDQFKRSALTPK